MSYAFETIPPKVKNADVPCNGCTACCKVEDVILYPEVDDISSYETRIVYHGAIPLRILKHKPEGGCVYLGEKGCTIHPRRPAMCRAFDCRTWYLRWQDIDRKTKKTMKRNGFNADPDVLEAGRQRLSTLEA